MDLIQQISDLRKEKNISREKLAAACGLTAQTIYRAEKNGKITLTNYNKILQTLKTYGTADHHNN
jgi:transcriptional regulator with XRE-family HTH domain